MIHISQSVQPQSAHPMTATPLSSTSASTPNSFLAVAAAAVGVTAGISSPDDAKPRSAGAQINPNQWQRPEVTEEDVSIIAGPAEEILKLHEDILARMEARESDWDEPTQGVSDILLELLPRFNLHKRYAKNHPRALATLDWLTRRAHGFARFIEARSRDPYGMMAVNIRPTNTNAANQQERANFLAYLALPLDRVLRTAKFLDDLLRWTTPDHPDYDGLKECRDRFEEQVLTGVVHELRASEDQLKVLDVQANVHSLREPLAVSTTRKLVYHGRVSRIDPITKSPELMYLFMFDDMAVWCRESMPGGNNKSTYTFKERHRVRRGAVTEIQQGEGFDGCFGLQLDGHVQIVLPSWGTGSVNEREAKRRDWILAISSILGQEVRRGVKETKKAIQRAKESLVLDNVDRIY